MGRWWTVRGITGAPASRHTKHLPNQKTLECTVTQKKIPQLAPLLSASFTLVSLTTGA